MLENYFNHIIKVNSSVQDNIADINNNITYGILVLVLDDLVLL